MRRSKQREQAFFLIYQSMFNQDNGDAVELYNENVEELSEFARSTFESVSSKTEELDGIISQYLRGWKINRIPRINLAILRLAVYEVKYTDIPPSVAINEAVELAKTYSGSEDASFINGILGSVVKDL